MSWNDANCNPRLDPGELGAVHRLPARPVPDRRPDAYRPYSEEINAGIEHQLCQNLAVGASYHRRQHRNGLGLIDLARPASAYTPDARTFVDPESGQTESITIYKLQPAVRQRCRTADHQRRRPGERLQRHDVRNPEEDVEPLADAGRPDRAEAPRLRSQRHLHPRRRTAATSTIPTLINRDDGAVFTDLPWMFNLSGSYSLPWDVIGLAASTTARAGDPLSRTTSSRSPPHRPRSRARTVRVANRGDGSDRDGEQVPGPPGRKRFTMGTASLEPTLDVFNMLNANHVLLQNEESARPGPADPHPGAADRPVSGSPLASEGARWSG